MDKKIILARIEELMIEKGITRYQLKENADISSTIYQWKKNATRDKNRVPSLKSIEKICNYFGVSLSYFFAFSADEQRETKVAELSHAIKNLSDSQLKLIETLVTELAKTNTKM